MEDETWFRERVQRADEWDKEHTELLRISYDLLTLSFQQCEHFARRTTYSPRDIIPTLLFFRLTETSQAILHLSRYGFDSEAAVVSRSQLEFLVHLKLSCDKDDYWKDYHEDQHASQIKMASALARSENDVLKEWREEWSRREAELKATATPKRLPNFEQRCREAGLADYYDAIYRSHSSDTHGSALSLMRHLRVPDRQNIKGLVFLPNQSHHATHGMIFLTVELLLRGVYAILRFMGVTEHDGVNSLKAQLEAIGEKATSLVAGK